MDKEDLKHLQTLSDAEVPIQPSDQVLISPSLDATYDGTLITFHYNPFCFLQLKPLPLPMVLTLPSGTPSQFYDFAQGQVSRGLLPKKSAPYPRRTQLGPFR